MLCLGPQQVTDELTLGVTQGALVLLLSRFVPEAASTFIHRRFGKDRGQSIRLQISEEKIYNNEVRKALVMSRTQKKEAEEGNVTPDCNLRSSSSKSRGPCARSCECCANNQPNAAFVVKPHTACTMQNTMSVLPCGCGSSQCTRPMPWIASASKHFNTLLATLHTRSC